MKNPAPLFTYLCNVHDEFAKLVPMTMRLFSDASELEENREASQTLNVPEPHLNYNSRRHALALTMLYADKSPASIRDEIREIDTSPEAVARLLLDLILDLAYGKSGHRPTTEELVHNNLLHNLTLKVGTQFMSECLHALAREMVNSQSKVTERGGEYAYAYHDQGAGGITDAVLIQDEVGNDVPLGMTITPYLFAEAVRGFARLAVSTDQLGRATISLMHYSNVRQYKRDVLADLIGLIADIESSDA